MQKNLYSSNIENNTEEQEEENRIKEGEGKKRRNIRFWQ